jgi:hypothetical protein
VIRRQSQDKAQIFKTPKAKRPDLLRDRAFSKQLLQCAVEGKITDQRTILVRRKESAGFS